MGDGRSALIGRLRSRVLQSNGVEGESDRSPAAFPAVSERALQECEEALGFTLPETLRRIYLEVADGGFGPDSGLLGIEGHRDADGLGIGQLYSRFRRTGWPERLLPICDFGCAAWMCVDAASADERIIVVDAGEAWLTSHTLPSVLAGWLAGVSIADEMFDTTESTIMNPFTKAPMTIRRRGRPRGTRLARASH